MVVSCCWYKIVPVTGHRTQRILKGITGSGSGQILKRDQWIWLWADTARDNWMWQWADTERANWIRQWAAQVPTNWRGGAQPWLLNIYIYTYMILYANICFHIVSLYIQVSVTLAGK